MTTDKPTTAPPPDRFPFAPRWAAVVPTALVVGGIAVFTIFFMDGLVERAIEKAGAAANGAKVELDGVDISLLKTSVVLHRLQVADAEAPMTNVMEIARMTFKLDPKPLAWKKIVIQDASIEGVRTGTPRKTSGALPRKISKSPSKKEKPGENETPSLASTAMTAAWSNLKDKYDPSQLRPEDLASWRKAKEEQERLKSITAGWETGVDALRTADLDDRAKAFADKLKNQTFSGLEGVKKAQELIKEAKALQRDAKSSADAVKNLEESLKTEIARAKASVKVVDALRKQDVENAVGGIQQAVSVDGITQGLLGPEYAVKIRRALALIEKIRAKIPKKKEPKAKPPPPPPRTGRDIPFPFKYDWPAFHLVKAGLSGETGGSRAWSGVLSDASSDPRKVGRPTVLDVKGQKTRELALTVRLDHTQDVPKEEIKFLYAGIRLDGMKLGDAGGPITVSSGTGGVNADIKAEGDALSGEVVLSAQPIRLSHAAEEKGDRLMSILSDVLSQLTKAQATLHLSGVPASPRIRVTSSLDDQIREAVKKSVQKELDDLRAKMTARISSLVDGERKDLETLVEGRGEDALKKLGLKDKQVEKAQNALKTALDDLQKKGSGSISSPGDLKNLFKKK